MRLEVHVHADIPILEGVSKRQLEAGVRAAARVSRRRRPRRREEPRARRARPQVRREGADPHRVLDRRDRPQLPRRAGGRRSTTSGRIATRRSRSTSRCTTRTASRNRSCCSSARRAQAIHEAQRRCMIEDVAAILGRQFDKARSGRSRRAGERPVRPRLEGQGFAGEEARARVRNLHAAVAEESALRWQDRSTRGSTRLPCTRGSRPIRRPAAARCRSTRPPRTSSATPSTPRRSSTWSARAMSIRASRIRP